MRSQPVGYGSAASALAAVAVAVGFALAAWPSRVAPPDHVAPSSRVIPSGLSAPTALDEGGIMIVGSGSRPTVSSPADRPLSQTPRTRPRLKRRPPQPQPGESVALPVAEPRARTPDAGASVPATPVGKSQPQTDQEAVTGPSPTESVVPPASAALAPTPPVAAVLTPPVPLDVSPPRHPAPYRMVVDAPGLASGARLEAIEARVRLRVVIRADGTVGAVEIAVPSGRATLDGAAMEAARQWRFLPARRDGEPIESVALIWVAFVVGP